MAADYCIVIKSRAGVMQLVLSGQGGGFRRLSYQRTVNDIGALIFEFDGDRSDIIDTLEPYGQVECWRWDDSSDVAPYLDFDGLFVDEERFADNDGNSIFRAICRSAEQMLMDAIVAYPANVENFSIFTELRASTILLLLVIYNATTSATTGNGRLRNSDQTRITTESDEVAGAVMTFACAQQNLLAALQDVARIGQLDFIMSKTGAQTWLFHVDSCYGNDRSADVVFALNYGNMANPVLKRNRLGEKTIVIVGGQGTEGTRDFEIRTGTNYNADYNSKEVFYPATQYTTSEGLQAAGDIRAEQLRAKDDLAWDVIQTPGCLYGVHYALGDLVTGYYQGVTAVKQIKSVSVTYAPGNDRVETIQVETENIYGS